MTKSSQWWFLAVALLGLLLLRSERAVPGRDRARILSALKASGALHPPNVIAHLSHVGSVIVDGRPFPVVDVRELVRSVSSPRGWNQIIVLDEDLKLVKAFNYDDQRPLFCRDNELVLWGSLNLPGTVNANEAGNVLSFSNAGKTISARNVDYHEFAPHLDEQKRR
jgi:hypothetical protein